MSWNRPVYDVKAYEQQLKESQGPGSYYYGAPRINDYRSPNFDESCKETQCYSFMPGAGGSGVSTSKDKDFIQVENDLLNINMKYTKDQEVIKNERNPKCEDCEVTEGLVCGGGVTNSVKSKNGDNTPGNRVGDNLTNYKECGIPSEETRTSNPPSNLRGTGFNRWEHLDRDPQEHFEVPRSNGLFAPTISSRIIVKDNHRPCLPNLLDQTAALPKPGPDPKCARISNPCEVPTTALHTYYVNPRQSC